MFFGSFVGLTAQGVRASATARVGSGQLQHLSQTLGRGRQMAGEQSGRRWHVDADIGLSIRTGPNPDVYIAQNGTSSGTGFTLANDYGTEITLKTG